MSSKRQSPTDRHRQALCLDIGRLRRRLDHRAMRLVDRVPIPGLGFGSFRRHPIRWLLSAGAIGAAVGRWTAEHRDTADSQLARQWESVWQAATQLFRPHEPATDDTNEMDDTDDTDDTDASSSNAAPEADNG